jgi:protocatechuate 4,5-dioxygenase alpha subunit
VIEEEAMSNDPASGSGPLHFPDAPALKSRLIDYSRPIAQTYLITAAAAQRGFRFSKFCRSFMDPAARERFKADQAAYMREFELDETEQRMVREHDWLGMQRHGVSFFLVLKLAGTLGVGQNHVGAAMRGESYEAFLKTRNLGKSI